MATPLTDSINALTAYANETTGASDTTLSDAVGRLCEGYGGGDSPFTVEKIKTYTVEESWENDTKGNPVTIFTVLGLDKNDLTNYSETFLCIFNNNVSKQYKCDFIQYSKENAASAEGAYASRNNHTSVRSSNSTGTSVWASIGTIIDVYKVKINV